MGSGVYRILNIFNGRLYVGSAVDVDRRWRWHHAALGRGDHHCVKLQIDWMEFGAEAFLFEILETTGRDRASLIVREQFWIDEFLARGEIYNSSPRAYSNAGIRHTERSRQRMSAAHLGNRRSLEAHAKIIAAQTGLVRSEETKRRIAAALLGKRLSAEHREKIGAARRGRKTAPLSDEHREKIAAALRGRKYDRERVRKAADARRGKKRPRHTPEWNAKIAAANRGKSISQETRDKISASLTGRPGRPHSEEAKRKIAEAARLQHAKRREVSRS